MIFILTDEADFDGAAIADQDLWADVSGCCDSPGYGIAPALPEGYVLIDNGHALLVHGPVRRRARSRRS